jgi:vWA-MoxR associated protein C-terminal domain/vWA-MoxR associated protein middle region (VMAP-M) 1
MGNLYFPLQTRAISIRERNQLVEKLRACHPLKERSQRDPIVSELPFADSISRSNANATDIQEVAAIVKRCLDFPPDGLQQLCEILKIHERDSLGNYTQQIQDLNKFLILLFSLREPCTINLDLLTKLCELTAPIHMEKVDLYDLYRQSRPNHQLREEYQNIDEYKTLSLMIQDLAQEKPQSVPSQSRLTHPLLTFVKHLSLSQRVPEPVSRSLRQWLEDTTKEEHLTPTEDTTIQRNSTASYYLLITFRPIDNSKKEFEIYASFTDQHGKRVPDYKEVRENGPFEKVLPLLGKVISQCEQYIKRFTIELFLPFTLLNCDIPEFDVHKWEIKFGFTTRMISHKHPLVLRSYDRIYGTNEMEEEERRRIRQAWENNWKQSKEFCGTEILQWPLKERDPCKGLGGWLELATCVTVRFVPPTFNEQQHIFLEMMSGGTSVALWPRPYGKCLQEDTLEEGYRTLLEGCHLSKLPKLLLEKRMLAEKNETLLANHVTLFWDDPDRLPPDAPEAMRENKYLLSSP